MNLIAVTLLWKKQKAKRNKEKPNSNQLAHSVSICHQHYNLIIDNNYSAGPSCFEGRLALTQAIYLFFKFIFYFSIQVSLFLFSKACKENFSILLRTFNNQIASKKI